MDNNDYKLKSFFDTLKQDVPNDGFSQKVMSQLPPRTMSRWLWLPHITMCIFLFALGFMLDFESIISSLFALIGSLTHLRNMVFPFLSIMACVVGVVVAQYFAEIQTALKNHFIS